MNDWTKRLRDMGLTQQDLANLMAVTLGSVKYALPRSNAPYTTMIRALELMTPEQRERFLRG